MKNIGPQRWTNIQKRKHESKKWEGNSPLPILKCKWVGLNYVLKKSKIVLSLIEFNRFSQHKPPIASKKQENSMPWSTKTKGVSYKQENKNIDAKSKLHLAS